MLRALGRVGILCILGFGTAGTASAGCPPTTEPYVLYPDTVRPFSDVFRLWVRPRLLQDWSPDDFRVFMEAVFDSNRTTGDDLFPQIWDYFCTADRDTAWDRIRIPMGGTERTKLDIYLKGVEGGPGHASGGSLYTGAYEVGPFDAETGTYASCEVIPPRQAVFHSALAHELVHLAWECNTGGRTGAFWSNEMMATASEKVVGWSSTRYANLYDMAFPARGPSAPNYALYRLWMAYLTAHFAGEPGRPENDLLYRWLRATGPTGPNIQFYGLARVLDSSPLPATWASLPGGSGDERVAALFQRVAIARLVDRAEDGDGRYGFGGLTRSRDQNYYAWADTNVIRVRCLPPRWTVGEDPERREGSATTYVDPVDVGKALPCRTRTLGIRDWGTDTFVFVADSLAFRDGAGRTLRIALEPEAPLEEGWRLQAGYVLHASADSLLPGRPVVDVVERAARTEPGEPALAFDVPAFGATARSVAVVVTLVQDPIPEVMEDCVDLSLRCMKEWGCSEPSVRYRVTWELAGDPD